jgi:hypothetical protein
MRSIGACIGAAIGYGISQAIFPGSAEIVNIGAGVVGGVVGHKAGEVVSDMADDLCELTMDMTASSIEAINYVKSKVKNSTVVMTVENPETPEKKFSNKAIKTKVAEATA